MTPQRVNAHPLGLALNLKRRKDVCASPWMMRTRSRLFLFLSFSVNWPSSITFPLISWPGQKREKRNISSWALTLLFVGWGQGDLMVSHFVTNLWLPWPITNKWAKRTNWPMAQHCGRQEQRRKKLDSPTCWCLQASYSSFFHLFILWTRQ